MPLRGNVVSPMGHRPHHAPYGVHYGRLEAPKEGMKEGGKGRRDQRSLRVAPHKHTSKVAPLMLAFLGTIWNDYHCASVPVMENYGVIQAKRGEGELLRGREGAADMEVGAGD